MLNLIPVRCGHDQSLLSCNHIVMIVITIISALFIKVLSAVKERHPLSVALVGRGC